VLELSFSRSGERRGDLQRLADETGLSAAMISRTIAGDVLPSVRTLVLLARALGVTLDRLVTLPELARRISSPDAEIAE
jgi:transcriptional regulator with XRE-family HTH domain